MELSVRRAGPEEAETLRAIRLEALSDSPGAYGTTYDDVIGWSLEQWAARLSGTPHFFGLRDSRVRGLAVGGTHDRFPGTLWLFGMYVGPDARGTGLAEALVRAVEAWAAESGAHELHLSVVLSQQRAVAFYRRLGYVEVGEVRAMHRDANAPIQTMVRRLD